MRSVLFVVVLFFVVGLLTSLQATLASAQVADNCRGDSGTRRDAPVGVADPFELRKQRTQPNVEPFVPSYNSTNEPDYNIANEPTPSPADEITDPEPESNSVSAERSALLGASRKPLREMDWNAVFSPSPKTPDNSEPNELVESFSLRAPHFGKPQDFTYTWAARNLAHRTLYFEDMPLERYGQSCGDCVQPFKSGARFLADAVTLPLQWLHEKPCDLHYVLGLDRPGNCSCQVKQRVVPRSTKH